MHISPPDCPNWAQSVLKCLTIGTHCTLCARSAMPGIDLCTSCKQLFKPSRYTNRTGSTTALCPGCGLEQTELTDQSGIDAQRSLSSAFWRNTAAPSGTSGYCADCIEREGRFLRRIVVPYRYAYPVDRLIKRVKYREDRQLARVLGCLLAEAIVHHDAALSPLTLLPMPLHAARLKERGFNQAMDIAFWCGKRLDLPVAAGLVSRIVDTGSLAGLNRQERQLRILGAFRATDSVAGKRLAIVDDVMTTGASARELARELYDSGAESVELWVLARTSRRRGST